MVARKTASGSHTKTEVNAAVALTIAELPACCDPEQFAFATTEELEPLREIVGQDRALEAIRFGIDMHHHGYNLYALGPPGVGKFTAIKHFLNAKAKQGEVPPDRCYINNFQDPYRPHLLTLPAGRGAELRNDMHKLVEDLQTAIPAAFESDNYKARAQQLQGQLQEKEESAFRELHDAAKKQSIKMYQTPTEFTFIPLLNGEEVTPETFEKLAKKEQDRLEKVVAGLREQLREIAQKKIPEWRKHTREQFRELNHRITREAVALPIDSLRDRHAELPAVRTYLEEVERDVIANPRDFAPQEAPALPIPQVAHNGLSRYQVNLLIDQTGITGVPVVFEEHPSYPNLLGRVENKAFMGALTTDFTLIKPGALHRANGGYLILEARKLLMQPYAWEGLKQALYSRELRIESMEQVLSIASTASLEPESIPLDVKVVLYGDRTLYYMLYAYDPDFAELFKIPADFESGIDRSPENDLLYARMIATIVRERKLLPFDRVAVAAIIQQSMRIEADTRKLSTHMSSIADLIVEADYWARQRGSERVGGDDIHKVITAQVERVDRVRDRLQENILRDTIMIATAGEVVGQVNGLSVLQMGNFSFGQPSRITATTRLGNGRVIDIARETDMGGPTHSKGVFILSSFIGARYGQQAPLSFNASLAFEQSYGGVDGDSASLAELCALLSALSGAPIKQCFAMTGSINQHGQVQVIGGVNEKIEGFFDVCQARGLSGEQGVLIPRNNVQNLLLRHDVIDAIGNGKFHIYPMATVDQAIALLTGIPAGEADSVGEYPADSINGRVQRRLQDFANRRSAFAENAGAGDGASDAATS